MKFSSIVLRAVPFLLTFTAGLLIASIFVPISAPSFSSNSRFESYRKHDRHKKSNWRQMKAENEELKYKNQRLEDQVEELQRQLELKGVEFDEANSLDVPPPPSFAPVAPVAPVKNVKTYSEPKGR